MNIVLPAATALVYGAVTNSSNGNPLPNVGLNAGNGTYSANTQTDAGGNYYLGVVGDASNWFVGPNNPDPALAGFIPPQSQGFTPTAATATVRNFAAQPVTAHFTGTVRNVTGAPVAVPNATVVATSQGGPGRRL